MKCTEYIKLHSDIVRQVGYIGSLKSIISCSESTLTSNAYLPGVIITRLGVQLAQTHTVFKMNGVGMIKSNISHSFLIQTFSNRAQLALLSMKVHKLSQQVSLWQPSMFDRSAKKLSLLPSSTQQTKGQIGILTFHFSTSRSHLSSAFSVLFLPIHHQTLTYRLLLPSRTLLS